MAELADLLGLDGLALARELELPAADALYADSLGIVARLVR